jgi:hypothetical protein
MFGEDQLAIRAYLTGWDVQAADPPGTLRPWSEGEQLSAEVHDIWVRRDAGGPWRFQLMFDRREGDRWVYRRDDRIRRPIDGLTWEQDGSRYLAPEVQLLYKSGGLRPKDEQDWQDAAPLLDPKQRRWLSDALRLEHTDHPWIAQLS